ncbi:CoA ester lyase [Iodidimonas gelatinilytica]|uniref:CoA ester lyase n=1 Tax=Iodidimonas gelatinilytica TaxID=1236966 RepID=A0A5A7N1K8_9PROT|nr:CoA ester lyase [Iodidimonas gelatinilytica]GER01907.1 CoA ester lyase [Iodidimonas gelatinilytica]
MSFTDIKDATARINRSELAVPGSNRRFLEKAAQAKADVVFLDLEDSVSPELKDEARKNVIEALNDLDWGEKTVSVRLNGLDTAWTYRDVVDVLEQTGERLDLMMLPKVGVAADVYALDVLVSQVERAKSRKKRIGFELIIESALGLANANAIAGASPRNESLHFGVADFAASVKADTTQIGGPNPRYAVLTDPLDDAGHREVHWGDMWHYPVWQMVVAARAHGLRPIDGPFGDFSDEAGFRAHAGRAWCWAAKANGPFIPVRWPWPMRCSAPLMPRWRRPGKFWKRWKRRGRRGKGLWRWMAS